MTLTYVIVTFALIVMITYVAIQLYNYVISTQRVDDIVNLVQCMVNNDTICVITDRELARLLNSSVAGNLPRGNLTGTVHSIDSLNVWIAPCR